MADPLEALRKAKTIGAGPNEQATASHRQFAEEHPWLQGLADLFTGGATNPDFEPGPVDVLGAAAPFLGRVIPTGSRFLRNYGSQLPVKSSQEFEPVRRVVMDELFESNPAAREAYERAMQSQMSQVAAERGLVQAEHLNQLDAARDALLDLHISDRPRPIPTETGFEIPIPIQPKSTFTPSTPSGLRGPILGGPGRNWVPSDFESKFQASYPTGTPVDARGRIR